MQLLEIKDFNVLIENKPFFDQQVKNKQEAFEISRNNDYATGNLLVYLYHQKYYKLNSIDLSIQEFLNKLILQENQKMMV